MDPFPDVGDAGPGEGGVQGVRVFVDLEEILVESRGKSRGAEGTRGKQSTRGTQVNEGHKEHKGHEGPMGPEYGATAPLMPLVFLVPLVSDELLALLVSPCVFVFLVTLGFPDSKLHVSSLGFQVPRSRTPKT